MIVTADPHGDFNATSQILRYSALAREITVPRIPSITQSILAAAAAAAAAAASNTTLAPRSSSPICSPPLTHRPFYPPGSTTASSSATYCTSPNMTRTFSPAMAGSDERATMELAALEIARLAEELDYFRQALASEHEARVAAEAHLLSMEDRLLDVEAAVREDCAAEYERRIGAEVARWRASMAVELERGEEHFGRKIEVFERTMESSTTTTMTTRITTTGPDGQVLEAEVLEGSGDDKENVLVENVAEENERLRRENEALRRDLAGLSPTKRRPLSERGSVDLLGAGVDGARASAAGGGSPAKKARGSATPRTSSRRATALRAESGLQEQMAGLRVSGEGSPTKMRTLGGERWVAGGLGDDLF
jgi:hypothetical protein